MTVRQGRTPRHHEPAGAVTGALPDAWRGGGPPTRRETAQKGVKTATYAVKPAQIGAKQAGLPPENNLFLGRERLKPLLKGFQQGFQQKCGGVQQNSGGFQTDCRGFQTLCSLAETRARFFLKTPAGYARPLFRPARRVRPGRRGTSSGAVKTGLAACFRSSDALPIGRGSRCASPSPSLSRGAYSPLAAAGGTWPWEACRQVAGATEHPQGETHRPERGAPGFGRRGGRLARPPTTQHSFWTQGPRESAADNARRGRTATGPYEPPFPRFTRATARSPRPATGSPPRPA